MRMHDTERLSYNRYIKVQLIGEAVGGLADAGAGAVAAGATGMVL